MSGSDLVVVGGDDQLKRLIVEYTLMKNERDELLARADFSALAGGDGVSMAAVMGLMGKVDVLKEAYELTNKMELVSLNINAIIVGRLK